MAAGLGFKDFTTGEVLTAADVDGYLMQGVWVFASAAARDAAVTSPQEGNFAYLKDTNVTTYYTGTAWANLDTTGMTNPMTTTGDTIYSSSGSTPARLGIGSTGQVLTVAGGVPSWATPASGSTFVGAKAYGTTNQTISNFTVTAITWNNENFDTDSMHSTSTNTSRLTIPTGKTGYWQITASLGYDASAAGVRQIRLSKNGSFVNNEQVEATSSYGNTMGFSNILNLTAGDYIELEAFQTSGGNLDVVKSADTSYFAANFIGA